jgi:hypothetical protein
MFAIFFQEKLESFGLSTAGMVGLTSDGAATMVAAGRRLGIIHQLCHAHGVHLAVMDVLYKGQQVTEHGGTEDHMDREEGDPTLRPKYREDETHSASQDEEERGTLDDDLGEEIIMTENFYLEEYPEDSLLPDLSFTYKEVISDIRVIVKSFRHDRNHC